MSFITPEVLLGPLDMRRGISLRARGAESTFTYLQIFAFYPVVLEAVPPEWTVAGVGRVFASAIDAARLVGAGRACGSGGNRGVVPWLPFTTRGERPVGRSIMRPGAERAPVLPASAAHICVSPLVTLGTKRGTGAGLRCINSADMGPKHKGSSLKGLQTSAPLGVPDFKVRSRRMRCSGISNDVYGIREDELRLMRRTPHSLLDIGRGGGRAVQLEIRYI